MHEHSFPTRRSSDLLNVTTTVEGRGRYPVNLRYARDLRGEVEDIERVLVPVEILAGSSDGLPQQRSVTTAQVPLGELADVRLVPGPTQVKSEAGLLTAYVYIDHTAKDIGGYIDRAKKALASLKIPEGYRIEWGGEFQYITRMKERLWLIVPVTLLLILIIIYISTRSMIKTAIVLLAVPFSLVGSIWFVYLLGYNMSTAVWVGMIALAGLDAETGVVMLLYLDLAYNRWGDEGSLRSASDLKEAVMFGAVKRLRPKLMTVMTMLAGLIPIMFSSGTGSEVMKRIAAPMIGGVVTSTILELILYPAIYFLWRVRPLQTAQELL
jgi:copper/silver efflux system protein